MNLVTDGLPALALSLEPGETDTMKRDPYPSKESIFAQGMLRDLLWVGMLMSVISLGIGYLYWQNGQANWQTMVFTTLTLSQMALAIGIRSRHESVFKIGFFSNPALLGAVGLTFILQLLVIYVPFLQGLFETTALNLKDLGLCMALSTLVFGAMEAQKAFQGRKQVKAVLRAFVFSFP